MKQRLLLTLLLISTSYSTFGQTKVCIMGTIHVETTKLNSDSILKGISQFNPDIILYEADTILDIRSSVKGLDAIEFLSIHQYLKSKPKTQIYPFDWAGKRQFRNENNYWSKIDSMNKILNEFFANGKADTTSLTIIESFSDFNAIEKTISNEDLKTINQPYIRQILEIKAKWEYKKLLDMAKYSPQLSNIASTFQMGLDYWNLRNIEMSKNILEIIVKNPSKRILVQTGLNHKYYLTNKLLEQQTNKNFKLIEYWEK